MVWTSGRSTRTDPRRFTRAALINRSHSHDQVPQRHRRLPTGLAAKLAPSSPNCGTQLGRIDSQIKVIKARNLRDQPRKFLLHKQTTRSLQTLPVLKDRPSPRNRPPIQRFEKRIQLRLYLNNPPRPLRRITRPRHPRAINSSQKLYLPGADIHHAAAGERLADRGA